MAKQDNTRTSIDELNESLSSMEQKVENNKKMIIWAVVAIVVIAAIIMGFVHFRNSNLKEANNAISKADTEMMAGNDSVALTQYENVAKEYSNDAGNRAKLNSAIILYKQKKYDEAISYLKDFDPAGVIVGPASQSLLGDCYVNKGKESYNDALAAYDKAIKLANGNELYAPFFMLKKATVLRAQGDFAKEAQTLQAILDQYPSFEGNYRIDVKKLAERAKAQSADKK